MIEIDIRPQAARWRCSVCGRQGRYHSSIEAAHAASAGHRCGERGRPANIPDDVAAWQCRVCGESKPLESYRVRHTGSRQTLCRECENQQQKERVRNRDAE